MAVTMNKGIVIGNLPIAWVHRIDSGAIADTWLFDNLSEVSYTIKNAGASSESSGDFIEFTRADGVTIKTAKNVTSIKVTTTAEEDATPVAQSSDATNKGEIKIKTMEKDTAATSWTSFVKDIKNNLNSLYLITIPSGVSIKGLGDSSVRRPDGYVHMLGKFNGDMSLSFTGNNPTPIELSFISYKNTVSGFDATDLTGLYDGTTKHGISWKINATTTKTIYVPAISSSDATNILNGDIVIVPTETWS